MLPDSLVEGYARFRGSRYATERSRWETLAETGQRPDTLIIACCDSRAAPEIVFDAAPGELFVVRNVANLVPPFSTALEPRATSAAVEFAVTQLEVGHVVVMGHGRCGGIAAAYDSARQESRPTDFLGGWMALVRPLVHTCGCLDHADADEGRRVLERASVGQSLANLRTFPWIREREHQGRLRLHGAWFDIGLGELWTLEEPTGRWTQYRPEAATAA